MKIAQQEYEYLKHLHTLFHKNADGYELLKMWEQFTFYTPGIAKGEPEHEIFIREGEKRFLRKILIDLARFEKLEHQKLEIVDATQFMDEKDNPDGNNG